MTTGSWNRPGIRSVDQGSWSGGDRPKRTYVKSREVVVVRGKQTFIYHKILDPASLPTQRELDKPHAFTKSWNRSYAGDVQTYINNWGDPTSCTALSLGYSPAGMITTVHADGSPPFPGFGTLIGPNEVAQGLNKLREKLYGSDFNMSVFLGEGHQTLGLIADTAKRIGRSMRAVRRGDLAWAARYLTDGTAREGLHSLKRKGAWKNFPAKAPTSHASDWLALQYGWLPLLGDTYDAAQSLAHMLQVPFTQQFSVNRRKEKMSTKTFGGATPLDKRYYATWKTIHRVRWTIWVDERPALAYQLGLMNPEIVAWELMPWSFVVDWFIPIGQYLEARSAVSSLKAGLWMTSEKSEGKFINVTGALKKGNAHWIQGRFDRTVSTVAPEVPLPRFKPLADVASWRHAANAVALLITGSKHGVPKVT